MQEKTLLGVGNPLLDISVTGSTELLEKYNLRANEAILASEAQKPLFMDLMENYDVKYTAGGSVQNSLRVCQWILKKPNVCVFMGSVGRDKYSEILKNEATGDGVIVVYQYQEKVPTGTCAAIITNHQGNKRSLCANLAAAEHFTIDHIHIPENRKYIESAYFYYISGFFLTVNPETVYEIGECAAKNNRIFITNLSAPFICEGFADQLMKTLPYVDIVFGNETEAVAFAKKQNLGTSDMKEIALKITNLPKKNCNRKRMVIITQGHLPVLLARDGEILEFPIPYIPKESIIDTNGAGDAFVGGFLSQLIQGKSIEKCIECAIWAAAHIIQNSGCTFDKSGNYTHMPYPNVIWIRKPIWEITVKSGALLPVVALGLIGNIVLLAVIIGNRSLKTPTNLLIMNMAVTDTATLIVSSWMFLVRDAFQNYVLGELACNIEGFCEFSFLLTGVFNLIVISYNRLMAIVRPHEVHLTPKSAKICIIATWIFGLIVASPLIIFRTYKVRHWKNFVEIYCEENKKILPLYWNVIISLLIWIPLGIMFACYSAIFYKLDKYEKEVLKRMNPISVNYKKKVAKTLFVIAIVFIVCRVPFTALIFLRSKLLQEKRPFTFGSDFAMLWFVCHFLMFTNSSLNPYIYGLTNESIRRGFRNSVPDRCCCVGEKNGAKESPRVWVLRTKQSENMLKGKGVYTENGVIASQNVPYGVYNMIRNEVT